MEEDSYLSAGTINRRDKGEGELFQGTNPQGELDMEATNRVVAGGGDLQLVNGPGIEWEQGLTKTTNRLTLPSR